jgi:hypothetical protein
MHTAAGLEVAVEAVEVVDQAYPIGSSSSDSARSAQHTPERRVFRPLGRIDVNASLESTTGEPVHELVGELAAELAGDEGKDAKLLHLKAPAVSSSTAFSCTHAGSIKDRKGLFMI